MAHAEPIVYVVDDDSAMRESTQLLLESHGFRVETYVSATDFLNAADSDQAGCLILDVRMSGLSGLDLQAHLRSNGNIIPIIIVTGHGDVPMAVTAVKRGATEFLEKPVNGEFLIGCVRRALRANARAHRLRDDQNRVREHLKLLTPREHDVMKRVVRGLPNKQIAAQLEISERTVEAHRKQVLEKMRVRNAVELVNKLAILDAKQRRS